MRNINSIGKVERVQANYQLNIVPFHPDLYYYGIHGVEALYAVMGTGCTTLTRKVAPDSDVTTCTWKDGRVGVYNALLKPDPKQPVLELTGSTGHREHRRPEQLRRARRRHRRVLPHRPLAGAARRNARNLRVHDRRRR